MCCEDSSHSRCSHVPLHEPVDALPLLSNRAWYNGNPEAISVDYAPDLMGLFAEIGDTISIYST